MTSRAEPILAYIKEHPHTLVLPVADNIRDRDLKYMPGNYQGITGFSWGMLFQWMRAPDRILAEQNKPTDPIKYVSWLYKHCTKRKK